MRQDAHVDFQNFKNLLLKRKRDLLAIAEVGDVGAEAVELDQSRLGRLSRIDALQSQAMSQASVRRRGVELAKIAAALQRIADNEYGDCIECGENIPKQRLEVDPSALMCVRCAGQLE